MFEMEGIMNLGVKDLLPILLYLFHKVEKSLKGEPTLLILDELLFLLGHPIFCKKISEWLLTLRKLNVAVVLATQSLASVIQSGLINVLTESCKTMILLPNAAADEDSDVAGVMTARKLYSTLGLNDAQIRMLKEAVPKRHYYVMSTQGKRLVDFSFGPLALSFIAVSDKKKINHLQALKESHGDAWPRKWLAERGVHDVA